MSRARMTNAQTALFRSRLLALVGKKPMCAADAAKLLKVSRKMLERHIHVMLDREEIALVSSHTSAGNLMCLPHAVEDVRRMVEKAIADRLVDARTRRNELRRRLNERKRRARGLPPRTPPMRQVMDDDSVDYAPPRRIIVPASSVPFVKPGPASVWEWARA